MRSRLVETNTWTRLDANYADQIVPRFNGARWLCIRWAETFADFVFGPISHLCNIGSFWFDNWTAFGPLIKFIGNDGTRSLIVAVNATIPDVCKPDGWNLANPRCWSKGYRKVCFQGLGKPSLKRCPANFLARAQIPQTHCLIA
ncbi:hypothetical protein ISN44_As05g036170 [Arabidopsis suecica]|uniref:Uncharacterized protein n=1 Tax=Arabidopsis suecica TaxID=45249 RepID=A0A8T2DM04_ARASU|nr:hypothetical protein ISN44_As05g036170 [Arabidopsis suecica]